MRPIALALLLSACSLDRHPLSGGIDAAVPGDDAHVGPRDAELPDAADPPDAPADAPPDAYQPDAGCTPAGETCDLTDQDCDGRVDESACGCRSFEHGGHVYQDCPHVTGYDAWSGACRRLGPGYDLAAIGGDDEDDAIDAATPEPVWIGLNDFEENATYVWVDRTEATFLGPWLGSEGTRDNERCFVMHAGGEWDDIVCAATFRVLCEGDPRARCAARAADDTTCDGRDDDCDGAVDEDCDGGSGCVSRTFWDHVFLECATARTHADAESACAARGYALATVDHVTEDEALDRGIGEAWIGLRQAPGAGDRDEGWAWVDGSPVDYVGWGGGEPSDGGGGEDGQEDCARIRTSDDWADLACATALPFLCRRSFAP